VCKDGGRGVAGPHLGRAVADGDGPAGEVHERHPPAAAAGGVGHGAEDGVDVPGAQPPPAPGPGERARSRFTAGPTGRVEPGPGGPGSGPQEWDGGDRCGRLPLCPS
jgi:hypothetical protein